MQHRFWASEGCAIYAGRSENAHVVRHQAVALVLALNQPFVIHVPGGPSGTGQVALLPSLLPHRFSGGGHPHLFLFLDPATTLSRQLLHYHAEACGEFRLLDPVSFAPVLEVLTPWISHSKAAGNAPQAAVEWLQQRFAAHTPPTVVDARVQAVVRYIRQQPEARLNVSVLTRHAGLSESRLAHLFRAQVGMPIRKYILWTRMRAALQAAGRGRTLTEAAYEGGFADAAHFSRTFSAMFGAAPSAVLRA